MSSRSRGSGTGTSTSTSAGTASAPPKKAPKKETPDTILTCSNSCGFMTRYPDKQALQTKDKKGKETGPAKTESKQYLCPNCRRNGISSTLKPYP